MSIAPERRQELERLVRSGKPKQRIALRARLVLGAADGTTNNAVANIRPAVELPQWGAILCGVSKASEQRSWHAMGFKSHLIRKFELSNDPDFVENHEDVVELYMNPPDHTLVFGIDGKSQI